MRRFLLLAVFAGALSVMWTRPVDTYVMFADRWPAGNIVMHLQLGESGPLSDGATSWGKSAEAALSIWNESTSRVKFTVVRDSTAEIAKGNGINNVFWSSAVYGAPFGDRTLATTMHWSIESRKQHTESDVIFNSNLSWNSYRGNLKNASGGGRLNDFRRVALHEFGHVLGLDHPDEAGQRVTAQMNSTQGNLDTLANDDKAGVRSLYQ